MGENSKEKHIKLYICAAVCSGYVSKMLPQRILRKLNVYMCAYLWVNECGDAQIKMIRKKFKWKQQADVAIKAKQLSRKI